MTRKLRMMSWETYMGIMDTILPTPIPMLSLVGFGEPTLHPRIVDMIDVARRSRPDLVIKITTNGSRMTEGSLDKYFDAGLDLLEISVFGYSPASYEALMGGLKFQSIQRLLSALNSSGYPFSLTTVQTDQTSADDIRAFWASLGAPHVAIKGMHRRGGYLELDRQIEQEQALGGYNRRPVAVRGSAGLAVDSCHKLYMFLHVNANGQILPCVQEINLTNVLGTIPANSSIESVVALTRDQRPTFDICMGCELKQQDLMQYYATFFADRFPDRFPSWLARLAEAESRT
ncbi:hypothetical protein Aph01nite_33520 [Acrocarpospora phusangensis]|uniref:Radical SAM core domain-containing protein n=2 Tax=Acrocarpospora phusangensis TaxID=1070424 RepID=A0A919Q9X6_9ACTN|nr:hypothetical protein Aph01nite_33520 [Acrocarpospora phusangensis]